MSTTVYTSEHKIGSNPYMKYRGALTYSSSHTTGNAKTTISVTAKVQMTQAYGYGVKVASEGGCGSVSKGVSGTGYLSSNPGTSWKTVVSKSYSLTISGKSSKQTAQLVVQASGVSVSGHPSAGGKVSKTVNVSVPALTSYTVKYNANGGSGAPSSQTKYYGKTLTLSSTKPTRSGYTFKGWSTSSSATSATYSAGGSYTSNSSTTLYAVWQRNTWTVTYQGNGGIFATEASGVINKVANAIPSGLGAVASLVSTSSSSSGGVKKSSATVSAKTSTTQTKVYNQTLTLLKSGSCSQTGYTLQKWNTNSSGTGTSYSLGGSYTANASITLYAIWKINTYTIKYNANGGVGAPGSQSKNYGGSIQISNTVPTRANFTFAGWGTSATSTTVVYKPGDIYSADASVTLFAIWKSIEVVTTLFVLDSSGRQYTSQTKLLPIGIANTVTAKSANGNYKFLGWVANNKPSTIIYPYGTTAASLGVSSVITISAGTVNPTFYAVYVDDSPTDYKVVQSDNVKPLITNLADDFSEYQATIESGQVYSNIDTDISNPSHTIFGYLRFNKGTDNLSDIVITCTSVSGAITTSTAKSNANNLLFYYIQSNSITLSSSHTITITAKDGDGKAFTFSTKSKVQVPVIDLSGGDKLITVNWPIQKELNLQYENNKTGGGGPEIALHAFNTTYPKDEIFFGYGANGKHKGIYVRNRNSITQDNWLIYTDNSTGDSGVISGHNLTLSHGTNGIVAINDINFNYCVTTYYLTITIGTIPASGYWNNGGNAYTWNSSKDGLTTRVPVGIAGWNISGEGSSYVIPYMLYVTNGARELHIGLRNFRSSAATGITFGMQILFRPNN